MALTFGGMLLFAPAGLGAVTIGSDLSSPGSPDNCTSTPECEETVQQTKLPGREVTAPTDGVIVRWRIRDITGTIQFRVIRSAGGSFVKSVGLGGRVTSPDPEFRQYDVRLPVKAGDYIGLDSFTSGTFLAYRTVPGAKANSWIPRLPEDGTPTSTSGKNFPDGELMLNADIEPDLDADGFGDESQDDDDDNDGVPDSSDAFPGNAGESADTDGDGIGNNADADDDNDGALDGSDAEPLNPLIPGPFGATNGNDTLTGDAGANVICGFFGDDTINGLGGNDTLFGDACNKTSRAQTAQLPTDGNDKLNGDDGNDRLYGAGGKDRLKGGKGNDKLFGGIGNDSLSGEAGKDGLDGGAGNDKLDGGTDKNSYKGGAGNDSINARNKKKETVDCGSGKKDGATVDRSDRVKGCEKVKRARK